MKAERLVKRDYFNRVHEINRDYAKKVRGNGDLDQSGSSEPRDFRSILKVEMINFPDAVGERSEKMK